MSVEIGRHFVPIKIKNPNFSVIKALIIIDKPEVIWSRYHAWFVREVAEKADNCNIVLYKN